MVEQLMLNELGSCLKIVIHLNFACFWSSVYKDYPASADSAVAPNFNSLYNMKLCLTHTQPTIFSLGMLAEGYGMLLIVKVR